MKLKSLRPLCTAWAIGVIDPGDSGRLADHEVAVAWDAVTSFVVFESVKQYLEHTARYKPSLLERLRR